MLRHPPSRVFYAVAAVAFGVISYQIVEYAYTEELDRVPLLDLPDDPPNLFKQSLTVHDVTFVIWVAIEQVTRFFGRKPEVIIPFTPPFDDAADEGKPLVMTSPQNVGSVVMRDLAAQITVAAPIAH